MSPGNQGVFQLLKEITFRNILAFYSLRKWSHFGVLCVRSGATDWIVGLIYNFNKREKQYLLKIAHPSLFPLA